MKTAYFRTVMPQRKSCPSCGEKLETGESVWSFGEYVFAKWRSRSAGFCKKCVESEVYAQIRNFIGKGGDCGGFQGYRGTQLPAWLSFGQIARNERRCL